MSERQTVTTIKKAWSHLYRLYTGWLRPFWNTVSFSLGCLRRTFRFFFNTPHFPTVVIAISIATTIFANVNNPTLSTGETSWASFNLRNSASSDLTQDTQADESAPGTEVTGYLRPGDSLTSSFRRHQITDSVRFQVIEALKGVLDFRDLRPHDRYAVRLDPNGDLLECTFESGPLNVHKVLRQNDGSFFAERVNIPLERRTVKVNGQVTSSLYGAFLSSREEPRLIYAFADIFAAKIDFNTETRTGDSFSMIFEKYYKDGSFVGYGKILYARYDRINDEPIEGYYHTPDNSNGAYFDRRGEELGAFFIRSPVPMARVSSPFNMQRMHPILQFTRPHPGVDLAAPTGTPVMAAADGRVVKIGWNGGYGKQIVVEHANGYRTLYSHLSGYRSGLTEGSRVSQKQTIGYVGSTGLSTGPHLDYRVQQNGTFVNPFAMKIRPRSILQGAELAHFRQQQTVLAQLSKSLDDPKVVLVKNITITPDTRISFL